MDLPNPPTPEVTADATDADTGQMLGRQDAGSLFPKPVPIFGEDPNAYEELHRRIIRDVAPKDAVEELSVKDIVDLAVEADRFRRMKDALLMNAAASILHRRLQNASHPAGRKALNDNQALSLVSRCQRGDEDALAEVTAMLAEGSQGFNAVMAEAMAVKLSEIEKIASVIASVDARRSKALSSMERRRKDLAARVKAALPRYQDARMYRRDPGGSP